MISTGTRLPPVANVANHGDNSNPAAPSWHRSALESAKNRTHYITFVQRKGHIGRIRRHAICISLRWRLAWSSESLHKNIERRGRCDLSAAVLFAWICSNIKQNNIGITMYSLPWQRCETLTWNLCGRCDMTEHALCIVYLQSYVSA